MSTAARLRLAWALVRVPAAGLVLYLLRYPILDLVEQRFDIYRITQFAIDVLSTPATRLTSSALLFSALLLVVTVARRLHPVLAYAMILAVAAPAIAVLLVLSGTSARRGMLVLLVLAANLAPIWRLLPRLSPRVWNACMLVGVGVAELLFLREYWRWLRGRSGDSRRGVAAAVPGLVLASLTFGLLIRGDRLLPVEQALRMSPGVRVIDRRSYNWIELDASGRYLFATGHDLPRLRRFDVHDLDAPPMESDVPTGGAQGFAYDPAAGEIYAVNTVTRQLLYLDAASLRGTRAVDLPDLSPGDPWVAVDPGSGTLAVVSEADLQAGVPFIVLERSTGRTLAREQLDAGNVLVHPTRPALYLSFFRRRNQLMRYDLTTRKVTHSAVADPRSERMVFWAGANEVLVTSPMESRILRFDADRLEPKGFVAAPFGARAIAIDERRSLLLCGNLATGYLVVIDLRTGEQVRRYYLGPWLRTIHLDAEQGTAYVSSNGALYRLAYAQPNPKRR